MRACSIDGCDGDVRARGWCFKHYMRWRRHGDPLAPSQRSARYGTGRTLRGEYVYLWMPGHILAISPGYVAEHRLVAWNAGLLTNPLDDVHHKNGVKDDNRLENLQVMTKADHAREHDHAGARSRAKTHCPQGHPYDEANTYVSPSTGQRVCRSCKRAIAERYRERRAS